MLLLRGANLFTKIHTTPALYTQRFFCERKRDVEKSLLERKMKMVRLVVDLGSQTDLRNNEKIL